MLRRVSEFSAFVALLVLTGCSAVQPAPVVLNQTFRIPAGALDKVAVIPFHAKDTLAKHITLGGDSPEAATELVARFMAEALVKRGFQVIPPSDLARAFSGQGIALPRRNPRAAAELAAREFGATAVMLGQVSRYRDRVGDATAVMLGQVSRYRDRVGERYGDRVGERYGSSTAASVAFEVSIHSAPAGHRLWTSKFDETQRALSENILNARRYPGSGMRWLTAAELAQWGAKSAVQTLPSAY